MIQLLKISNSVILKSYLEKDNLYKDCLQLDDLESWVPNLSSDHWFIFWDGTKSVGLIMIKQETRYTTTFHGGIYKKYRRNAAKYFQAFLDEFRDKHPSIILWTIVPSNYKHVHYFLRKFNFKQTGKINHAAKDADLLIFSM